MFHGTEGLDRMGEGGSKKAKMQGLDTEYVQEWVAQPKENGEGKGKKKAREHQIGEAGKNEDHRHDARLGSKVFNRAVPQFDGARDSNDERPARSNDTAGYSDDKTSKTIDLSKLRLLMRGEKKPEQRQQPTWAGNMGLAEYKAATSRKTTNDAGKAGDDSGMGKGIEDGHDNGDGLVEDGNNVDHERKGLQEL